MYPSIRDPFAIKEIDYQVHAIMIRLKPTLLHICCKELTKSNIINYLKRVKEMKEPIETTIKKDE